MENKCPYEKQVRILSGGNYEKEPSVITLPDYSEYKDQKPGVHTKLDYVSETNFKVISSDTNFIHQGREQELVKGWLHSKGRSNFKLCCGSKPAV